MVIQNLIATYSGNVSTIARLGMFPGTGLTQEVLCLLGL